MEKYNITILIQIDMSNRLSKKEEAQQIIDNELEAIRSNESVNDL